MYCDRYGATESPFSAASLVVGTAIRYAVAHL